MGTKYPSEQRPITFHLENLIPQGTALTDGAAVGFASQKGFVTTMLAASIAAGDTSIQLDANPGVGAFVVVDLGSESAEETFKVTAVSGGGPFVCDITPTAEFPHSVASVSYEVGVSARFLVTTVGDVQGTDVLFEGRRGVDTKTYRLSVIAPCDNGEVVEDEQDILVSEVNGITTIEKQPAEITDIPFPFATKIPDNTTLSSAIAWLSRIPSALLTTTVAGTGGTVDTNTIQLSAHPGQGAVLIINPAGTTREKVKVTSVSGSSPPFTATVDPLLWYAHTAGESVDYEPGATARGLTSPTATVTPGNGEATVRSRLGAAGQEYRLNVLGTCSDGSKIQGQAFLHVIEQ